MPIQQSGFDSVLTPIIYHHFELGRTRVPSMRSMLFSIRQSTLAEEKGTGIGAMSPDAFDTYKNSGRPGELDFNQGYTKTYTPIEYPVRFRIEKRLLSNDQYGIIQRQIQAVGRVAELKMELDAFATLNNAFSGSFVGADNVPLCSASHPNSPHDSATVQSNTGTLALSDTAVSSTRIAMMRFKNDKNIDYGVMPGELWVPPELEDKARKIAGSALEPETGNNAINPQSGRWTVRVAQRLTGTKAWFMVDGSLRSELLNWYNREIVPPMVVEETTTHITYEMKLYYSLGWDDWRFIYGHNPA